MTSASLSTEDRDFLISLARTTIEKVARGTRLKEEMVDVPSQEGRHGRLNEKGAAFVTLYQSGNLRGCIGTLSADKPLWVAVRDAARSAAISDQRFYPVGK